MDERGVLAALLLVVAVSATAQAAPADGALDDVEAPELPDSPDVDLSPAQDAGADAAAGASSAAGALGAVLAEVAKHLVAATGEAAAATAAAIVAAGEILAGAAIVGGEGLVGLSVATGQLLIALAGALAGLVGAAYAGLSGLVGAAYAALADALGWLVGHPAWQDPKARMAIGAAAGGGSAAAGLGIWAWLKRIGPFAGAPLYSRIKSSNVLDNPVREEIFEYIQDHPGAHTSQISDDLDLGWGTTVHHLKHLERHDMISKRKARNHTCYFENGGTFSPDEQEALAALKNEKARKIAEFVRERPGHSQKEIAEKLSISQSLVSWHVSKLENAGLIGRERNGKRREIQPHDDLQVVLGSAE